MKVFVRIAFVLALLFVGGFSLLAQGILFTAGANAGTYRMYDLKNLGNVVQTTSVYHLKKVSDFPITPGVDATASYYVGRRASLGLFGSYNATYSELNYSARSGLMDIQQQLNCKQLGLVVENVLLISSKWRLFQIVRIGVIHSNYKYTTDDSFNTPPAYHSTAFTSHSKMMSHGLSLTRDFARKLFLKLEFNYLWDFRGQLISRPGQTVVFPLFIHNNTTTDWSGFRGVLAIGYRVHK